MDFYKSIYIVYIILFFDTFYKICATMNIADCKLQYSNNINMIKFWLRDF